MYYIQSGVTVPSLKTCNVIDHELWYRLVISICSVVSIHMSGVMSISKVSISNGSQYQTLSQVTYAKYQ